MRVQVIAVSIPAMSTIGWGEGISDAGERVLFVGDHRPMMHLGEAMESARPEPTFTELEDWQIRKVLPPPPVMPGVVQ